MTDPLSHWIMGIPAAWAALALMLASLSYGHTVYMLFKRVQSPKRRIIVALSNLVAYLCVLMLLINIQVNDIGEDTVTLLTDKPARTEISVTQPVYGLPEVTSPELDIRLLPDVSVLSVREPAVGTLRILGHGLSANDWHRMPPVSNLDWSPPNVSGFVRVKWSKSVNVGDPLTVSGRFFAPAQLPENEIYSVTLSDMAGEETPPIHLRDGGNFSATVRVPVDGPLSYFLTARDRKKKIVHQERVTVAATPAPSIRAMIIQSSPSFEVRHFMNWAAAFRAKILVKTKISKDRFITQVANREVAIKSGPLSFDQEDFLIMDGRAYLDLTSEEKNNLFQAIRGGLGLLILADTELQQEASKNKDRILQAFELQAEVQNNQKAIPIIPAFDNSTSLPTLAVSISGKETYPLVSSTTGQQLTVAHKIGNGVVALTRLRQTNAWLTSGDLAAYSYYWSHLMSRVARPDGSPRLIPQNTHEFTRVNQRLQLCAWLKSDTARVKIVPTGMSQESRELTLTSDQLGSDRQCAYYDTMHTGWHEVGLSVADSVGSDEEIQTQHYVYVYGADDWEAADQYNRQQATRLKLATLVNHEAQAHVYTPLFSRIWIWAAFVLSAIFLWIERKVS